jgi:hypothetical protein
MVSRHGTSRASGPRVPANRRLSRGFRDEIGLSSLKSSRSRDHRAGSLPALSNADARSRSLGSGPMRCARPRHGRTPLGGEFESDCPSICGGWSLSRRCSPGRCSRQTRHRPAPELRAQTIVGTAHRLGDRDAVPRAAELGLRPQARAGRDPAGRRSEGAAALRRGRGRQRAAWSAGDPIVPRGPPTQATPATPQITHAAAALVASSVEAQQSPGDAYVSNEPARRPARITARSATTRSTGLQGATRHGQCQDVDTKERRHRLRGPLPRPARRSPARPLRAGE